MKESKKPQLRFKGYSEDWEEKTLGELCEIVGGGTPDTNNSEYWNGNIDWYSPTEIGKNIYANGSIKKITNLGLEKSSAKMLPANRTVLFSSRAGIGDMAILKHDGCTNQGFQSLVVKEKIDTYFIYSSGFKIKKYALKKAAGSTFLEISAKQLGKMNFFVSILPEQSKIGTLFKNIDTLITSKKAKYEKLLQIKKSLLEKMFPQDGQASPTLRFKGFTEDWEEKKLGEVMKVTSVKRIHQSDWTKEGVRFLRARDIVANYKNEKTTDNLFISKQKYDEYTSVSGKVKIEDLLVTGVGTIGIPMQIENIEPVYFKDGNIIWFQNDSKINGDFFYYSFCGSNIQNFIKEAAGTGTVGTYTIESGKKTPIILPIDKGEQTKIGNFFKELDTLLSLQKKELDKLQNVKKALLERMFV